MAFIKTIEDNIDLFKKQLGHSFTVESFLKSVRLEQRTLLDSLRHHEGLLGILLGYGRHNALLFQQKLDERDCSKIRLGSFSKKCDYSPFVAVAPLGFAVDLGHPETKLLTAKYKATRERINIAFQRASLLDAILEQLNTKT